MALSNDELLKQINAMAQRQGGAYKEVQDTAQRVMRANGTLGMARQTAQDGLNALTNYGLTATEVKKNPDIFMEEARRKGMVNDRQSPGAKFKWDSPTIGL
jgi:hypothetical protein